MPRVILAAENLRKIFGSFTALADVSLHLAPGEVVGLLGPNGAGKSTTMNILTGAIAPSGGRAVINGHDLEREPLACRAQIGYLPQEAPLYRDMRVVSYLDHVARLKGIAAGHRRAEVARVVECAHLQEVRRRYIVQLSGGNRQRVGLAQALIGSPPILILDEATAGLDPAQVANFRELLRELATRHSILLSTHIMAEVEACCSRVVVVHRGRVILAAPIEELRRRSRQTTRLRMSVLGDPAPFAADLRGRGWTTGLEVIEGGCRFEAPAGRRAELVALAQQHGGLCELVEERRSLEEVFRDLIREG
jgi:ABC-2 type transport system ATP-binding protein